jgi:hypothetical protein
MVQQMVNKSGAMIKQKFLGVDNNTSPKFNVMVILQIYQLKKNYIKVLGSYAEYTAGAGTAPRRMESTGKWANTSNPLDTINVQ